MADIIGFDKFEKKRLEKEEKKKTPESQKDSKLKPSLPVGDLMEFFVSLLHNPEIAGRMLQEVTSKMIRIAKVTADFNPVTYKEDRETVKSYSLEDLMNWVRKYDENDWQSKPAFFRAVADELKDRLATLTERE